MWFLSWLRRLVPKPMLTAPSPFALASPLASVLVTEGWGHPRAGRLHGGLDMRAPVGTPVYAAASGRVLFAGDYADGSGGAVELDHGNGVATRYLHLSRVDARKGQTVRAGDQLGASGFAKSPHLHFDVWVRAGELLERFTARFGAPKGLGDSRRKFGGVEFVKVPGEPLVPRASYQADVVAKATEYGVRLWSPLFEAPTLVALALLAGAAFAAARTMGA